MIYVLYTVHIVVSFFLILVVLLQQGKGADLSVFGGGSTQAAFGARGAATLLHKLTVGGFVLFTLTTLGIAFMQRQGDSGSVMSGLAQEQAQEQAVEDDAGSPPPAEEAAPAATADDASDSSASAAEAAGDEAGEEALEEGGGSTSPPENP